ncbi:GNAT family N-acetyltransferase [Curtobacterium sp. MCJR17_043]|uniref:GNAT family N-acetyltransferase n=1 Tax=Curtobacterium sp. MCJR17_043 TaxID=2175660 RepID=UPI0024E01175|nr:GNAT family N-acetyltransferase [Curtobacterium sp. MCJR17_043]WIB37126.1 GNAT family N-acetyltransferase [Curtobacterium sp. MCJR17_043]
MPRSSRTGKSSWLSPPSRVPVDERLSRRSRSTVPGWTTPSPRRPRWSSRRSTTRLVGGDWTLDRFERALSGSWIVCTVRDDAGRLVGMGRLISDGALHAFVTEMIVTEEARGGGIGGQVLARLVDEARRRGVDDVQLFAARGRAEFYERHGFERRAESGPGMDVASVR